MTPRFAARAAGLAFLVAATTLFVQVLIHRMVTAKLLNNYAFLVISLTMLGFALSGVFLSRLLERFLADLDNVLPTCCALFVLTALGSSIFFYHADAGLQAASRHHEFVLQLGLWVPLALPFAVPFAFCGVILGTLLSSPGLPTRTIYSFDLLGSALGAFAVIPAISRWGVESSLLAASATILVVGVALFRPRSVLARFAVGAAALSVVLAAAFQEQAFDLRYPAGSMLAEARRPGSGWVIESVAWDPVSRIEVSRIPSPYGIATGFPCLIGENPRFHSRFRRVLSQNNFAFTFAVDYDGNRESLQGIEETIYAAAYQARAVTHPRVAVIGVGGGFDVLTALYFGASEVTGMEVNAATLEILTGSYREYFKAWVSDPRVTLLHGDGRHLLATMDRKYDVIQLSGVDTYAGTPGAAHVFSESYLYTAEAFDVHLSRLTENGILNVMRLEYSPPREMLRALTTAVAALRRAGAAHPADHVVMLTATNGHFAALLVKRTPFSEVEQRHLEEWAARSPHFRVSAGPLWNFEKANAYQELLAPDLPQYEAAFARRYPLDIRPVDDNRPFFFKYSYWWHVLKKVSIPTMEYTILGLTAVIGGVALLCVLLPLRLLAAAGMRAPEARRWSIYFAGIGLGYMAVEIAFIQKFGLFLGHPNFALSVVLAALLVTTGLGSLVSASVVRALGGRVRFVGYALAAAILLEHALLPWLTAWIGLPFAARVAVVFLLVTPIGIALGTFLPSGLESLKSTAPAFVPWAWGINGVFSVLGPVLAVGLSMTWGTNALLLSAIPVYLVAGFALPEGEGSRDGARRSVTTTS